jgi:hypothetical protein
MIASKQRTYLHFEVELFYRSGAATEVVVFGSEAVDNIE